MMARLDTDEVCLKESTVIEVNPLNKPCPRSNMLSWVWRNNFYVYGGKVESEETFSRSEYVNDNGKVRNIRGASFTNQLLVFHNNDRHSVETFGKKPPPSRAYIQPFVSQDEIFIVIDANKTFCKLDMVDLTWSTVCTVNKLPNIWYQYGQVINKDGVFIYDQDVDNTIRESNIKEGTDRVMLKLENGEKYTTLVFHQETGKIFSFNSVACNILEMDVSHYSDQ